jgi:hypothetical protein
MILGLLLWQVYWTQSEDKHQAGIMTQLGFSPWYQLKESHRAGPLEAGTRLHLWKEQGVLPLIQLEMTGSMV